MARVSRKISFFAIAAVVLAVSACGNVEPVTGPIAAKAVKATAKATAAATAKKVAARKAGLVNVPKAALIQIEDGGKLVSKSARVTLKADSATPGVRKLLNAEATPAFPYDITYTAQVPPVVVAGDPVQANDIDVCGCTERAVIAYNTAGDIFAGAIQVVSIANPAAPAITKEIKFKAVDVNAVVQVDSTLYFGGQADPDVYGFKAFVGKIDLNNVTSQAIATSMKPVRSHTVTSLGFQDGNVYAGVGAAGGGVEVLDSNLNPLRFVAQNDVRSIGVSASSGVIGLSGTTDSTAATAQMFPIAGPTRDVATLPSFGSNYAKATIELRAGLAFLGLSEAGTQVRNLDGSLRYELANPEGDDTFVTNGVSADGDLAFVANGEYGFRVLRIKDRTKSGDEFAELAGFHRLEGEQYEGQSYSANIVRFKDNNLFVASGLGGLNLYALTRN